MAFKKNKITTTELNQTLSNIYKDKDGKRISMRVEKVKHSGSKKLLVSLIVFFALVAMVSWLGIFLFSRFNMQSSDNLKLEISGNEKVSAGEEVKYEIFYRNDDEMPVASAEIGLYLPKSFILTSSEPVLEEKNTLKLGTLKSGESGKISFSGKFFATEGDTQILQTVLNYKPSNFNANFQKVNNLEVKITDSGFDGSLDGPDKIIVGEDVIYKLIYKNKSNEELENMAIDLMIPQDFVISTSSPELSRENRWVIGRLPAKSDGEVEIRGSFSSEASGSRKIAFNLGVVDNEGVLLTLVRKDINTEVVGGDFNLSMLVNGANNFNTVMWGQSLNYSIVFKNDGKEILHNLEIRLRLSGLPKEKGSSIIDWSSLEGTEKNILKDDTLVWTKVNKSKLGELAPGEEGLIDFSIKVISKPQSLSYRDYKIDAFLEAGIERIGNVAVKRDVQAPKTTVFINSDTTFRSQARYYDDANVIIGTGPTPPKVGQKTTYKIFWNVTNSMHELEDMKISGKLPEGALFVGGKVDAGTVSVDESFENVVWSLNRLPTSVDNISASFDVSVTPNSDSIGKVLSILENIKFRAKDKSTGGIIELYSEDETTTLPDDPFVTKGEVE